MPSMEVISVNIWQILISLCNLLILYLIIRKFLYEPVRKMLEQRRAVIDGQYSDADEAKRAALADKAAYEEKLAGAKAEAETIRQNAVAEADKRGEKLLAEAKDKADGIVRRAEAEVELEKQKAKDDIRREIADVSTKLAEKLIEREIDEKDHHELIDSFIDEIGETK
ncbi:MAG: F0F1 ATP synthase subunit B [Clostridiales bacterium]|nr:F0F1 ATP synthase subunit B [Clostridiales bacterium]